MTGCLGVSPSRKKFKNTKSFRGARKAGAIFSFVDTFYRSGFHLDTKTTHGIIKYGFFLRHFSFDCLFFFFRINFLRMVLICTECCRTNCLCSCLLLQLLLRSRGGNTPLSSAIRNSYKWYACSGFVSRQIMSSHYVIYFY